jgi:Galactose oxidase, central domain
MLCLVACGSSNDGSVSAVASASASPVSAITRPLGVATVGDGIIGVSEARAVAKDGRIIIFGGDHGTGGVDMVQTFNAVSGSFIASGQMLEPRFVHSATLTAAGRIVVAGGFSKGHGFLASVEEFDQASGNSLALPPLCNARDNHHAVALNDGRIMFIGGDSNESDNYISRVEVYDPDSGPDTCDRHLAVGRAHEAVADAGDRVFVFGGLVVTPDFNSEPVTSIEAVDKTAGSVAMAGDMLQARYHFQTTVLQDGRVLITGGLKSGGGALANAEIYDPVSGRNSAVADMVRPRGMHSATLLPDGRVLIAGGYGPDGVEQSTEVFDPGRASFQMGPDMTERRALHVAATLDDGRVLLSGGYQGNGRYTARADIVAVAP